MADKGKKRKMAARASTSQTHNPDYNANMFRSLGCEKFHDSINVKSKFVKEKALLLAPGEFEEIRENISNRGWEQYVAYLKEASKALVFEFFSNVFPKPAVDRGLVFPGSTSYVRGCSVRFDAATINELFGLASVPVLDCMFKTKISRKNVKEDPERAAEIREALCKPRMDWVRNTSGEPQKILASSLIPVARGWAAFILATICPSSNQSELSLYRATLAACIIRGEPVNLGWVLEKELKSFANFKDGDLPSYWRYASLIALLCEKAGVVADADEDTISPAYAVTGNWIRSRLGLEHPVQREEPQQEQPDEQEPTFNIDDFSVGPSVEDFQNLQARMDVMTANQERMRRTQERMAAEYRFGMRALYRAMCTFQSGGQLDPEADIFQTPPQ